VKIFCPFTPQAAAGLSCAVTQEPRYDQRLISALATTQPKAVTVAVALVRAPNHRQPPEDLSRYVGGHSCKTRIRCMTVKRWPPLQMLR
jgi:hypothetical protein